MNIKKVLAVGTLALALTACGNDQEVAKTGIAKSEGYAGDIEVTVKLNDDGKIIDIDRTSEETEDKGEVSLDELTKELKGKESAKDLESVSGATISSDAFKKAVDEAIIKAK